MRARSALFTLFGDVIRPAGGEAWLSTLTGCMAALGFRPEATRTALHRMTQDGWVEPRREGRYAAYQLTDKGVDRLEEAAARIYRLRAVDWDGRWRLLVSAKAGRAVPLARALRWMGFGQLSGEVWVSPHAHGRRLQSLLDEHHLDDVLTFLAASDSDSGDIVRRAWDLGELREAHTSFLARWSGVVVPDDPPDDPQEAFRLRIELVHHWRSFLFLDPGLPGVLLPGDWLGEEAAALFRTLYEALAPASWAYYDALDAATPAARPRSVPQPDASPFARGLEALSIGRPA